MQDKYSGNLNELIKTLSKIELLIEDNNQNIKDCMSILKDINDIIAPKPKSKLLNFMSSLIGGKLKIM